MDVIFAILSENRPISQDRAADFGVGAHIDHKERAFVRMHNVGTIIESTVCVFVRAEGP
jgi:hypothetical protein